MSRIVVFGDTHLVYGRRSDLYEQLVSDLAGCDLAIHTGDIATASTLEMLRELAEIVAVYGNVCYPELRLRLRRREIVEADGVRIGVVHGDGGASAYHVARAAFRGEDLDLVVFGHSHRRLKDTYNDRLLLNPGSACQPRGERRSHAIVTTRPELSVDFVIAD